MRLRLNRVWGNTRDTRLAARVVAITLLVLVVSGVIHEMGHALAVWVLGGSVIRIQPFVFLGPPHVSYEGTFNALQLSVVHASGMLAAVLSGLVLLTLIPWAKLNAPLRLILSIPVAAFLSQTLAWVILPALMMFGVRARDDAVNFLYTSGIPPLLMFVLMLVSVILMARAFFKRTRYLEAIREIRGVSKTLNR